MRRPQTQFEKAVSDAAGAHTNLNIFAAVVSLLEGGHLYGDTGQSAERIIRICQAEQGRQLRRYDAATARAAKEGKAT